MHYSLTGIKIMTVDQETWFQPLLKPIHIPIYTNYWYIWSTKWLKTQALH